MSRRAVHAKGQYAAAASGHQAGLSSRGCCCIRMFVCLVYLVVGRRIWMQDARAGCARVRLRKELCALGPVRTCRVMSCSTGRNCARLFLLIAYSDHAGLVPCRAAGSSPPDDWQVSCVGMVSDARRNKIHVIRDVKRVVDGSPGLSQRAVAYLLYHIYGT